MGIIIRQGFKATVINYIGVIVGAINLLYLFPKFLSPQEIGLTRVFLDVSLMLATLGQIGTSGIIDKFYPFFKNPGKKDNGFFLFVLLYPLIGFVIICILFLFLKDFWVSMFIERSSLLISYYYYLLPLIFLSIYLNIVEGYCRAHYKIVFPIFIKEVFLRVFLALTAITFHYKIINLDGLVWCIIASYFFAIILLFAYLKVLRKLFLAPFSIKENLEQIKSILKFSFIIVSSGTLGIVASKIDVILLSSYVGLKTTGIYAIAFYIGTIIEIPRRALSQISIPLIAEYWKNNNVGGIKTLYTRTAASQFIIGTLIFLLVWCNVDAILGLIPNSEDYREGKYIILLIAMARLVDMLTGINTEIINTSPYYKVNFYLSIFSGILMISLNNFLIRKFGMIGAGMSTFIGYTIFNFFKIFYIHSKAGIQPFTMKHLYILIAGILVFLTTNFAGQFMEELNQIISIFIKSVFITLIFLGVIFFFRISPDLDAFYKSLFKKFKMIK